jgi:hypothetical protein
MYKRKRRHESYNHRAARERLPGRVAGDLANTMIDRYSNLTRFDPNQGGFDAQGIPTVVVVVVERCLCTGSGAAALVVVVVEEVSAGAATSGMVPLSLV